MLVSCMLVAPSQVQVLPTTISTTAAAAAAAGGGAGGGGSGSGGGGGGGVRTVAILCQNLSVSSGEQAGWLLASESLLETELRTKYNKKEAYIPSTHQGSTKYRGAMSFYVHLLFIQLVSIQQFCLRLWPIS